MDYFLSPEFVQLMSYVGTGIGFVYIVLQYKAHPYFWYVSVLNSLPLIFVSIMQGNYASAILFTYYLLAALQVLFFADKSKDSKDNFYIQHLPRRYYVPLAVIFVTLSVAFFFALEYGKAYLPVDFQPKNQFVQALDATATSLSFITMWVLTKQYLENWYGWLVVNATYVALFAAQGNWAFAANFSVFFIVACLGIPKWKKLMRQQAEGTSVAITKG